MYKRLLKQPKNSILLLGPRGTGKSTWISEKFPNATTYDLLNHRDALRFSKNPSEIYHELQPLKKNSWVVIDEVQKVPALLDEVHRLIEKQGLRFILSGSSARKLKRGGANLLAGRAIKTELFPFVTSELQDHNDPRKMITFGMLPLAILSKNPKEYLRTYTETYLQEEIKAEALTRNVGDFARFLEIAARQNGQITNLSNISRDAEVNRNTVENYFQILVDTLVGFWLPAWKLKTSNKQYSSPKFYFFDSGVCRALSGRLPYEPSPEELGPLVETFLLHELRAFLAYNKLYYPLTFWRSYDDIEVDVLLETSQGYVALEIKAGSKWRPQFHKGLKRLETDLQKKKLKSYGIYLGDRIAQYDNVKVFPILDFCKALWAGEIIE